MPEILKNQHGEIDYTKVFMAFGAMVVLILQQWQGYKIAEIKAKAEAQEMNYMSRDEIYDHINKLEKNFIPKDELMDRFNNIEEWMRRLEDRNGKK